MKRELQRRVWLIGGTQESAKLAEMLALGGFFCLVTVTTEAARSLYLPLSNLEVWVGRLDFAKAKMFLQEHFVGCILDASHPFAVEVSQLAIEAAEGFQIPYIRYERPAIASEGQSVDLEHLLEGGILLNQRVLLTLGYRSLSRFRDWQTRAVLFARILPSTTALTAALEAGFSPDRLIALRPPISADLERALWQQWQISLVVTKASGVPGGEDVKRRVAAELGVRLVAIERPAIEYPQQTSDLAEAVAFCDRVLGGIPPTP